MSESKKIMSEAKKLFDKIAGIAGGGGGNVFIAKVASVDTTKYTASVKDVLTGASYTAKLKALKSGNDASFLLIPKVDSACTCVKVLGDDEIDIINFDLIDEILLLGKANGGLVKSEVTANEFKKIVDDINALKQAIAGWMPAPNDGGAALKAALTSYTSQPLVPPQKTSFENSQVKH